VVVLALTLLGCLERVTGEAVPLDPRFHGGVQADDAPEHVMVAHGTGMEAPFAGAPGPSREVEVLLEGDLPGPARLDVWVVEGAGARRAGSLPVAPLAEGTPARARFRAPVGVGLLRLQAFVDLAGDGPGPADPFVSRDVPEAEAFAGPVTLVLAR
jgi:hypothetical protein